MTNADQPTASSRPHVTDMFHAGLATLPRDGAGNSEPQAAEALAINPELGSRIASLLSRLYHNGEEVTATKKQPNGGKRTYQVRCLRHEYRGEEGPHRPASFFACILRVAGFGAATRMTVTLRWVSGNCWLNLQANPTTLLTGTNAFAADIGLAGARELLFLLVYPFHLLRQILRTIDRSFDWSSAMAGRIQRGDITAHNLQVAFHIPFNRARDARRFLSWLQVSYCLVYVDERGCTHILGDLLGLRASTQIDDTGCPTGVLLRAHQGNNPDLSVNIYAKADTLEPEEKALLGEAGLRWLRRNLRIDVTLHQPAISRLFNSAGMSGAPRTIASVCRAVGLLDEAGNRLVDWLARETCVRRLKLPAVVGFRNGDFERAAAKLRRRPVVTAVWPRWLAGEGDLRGLLEAELRRGGMSQTKAKAATADNIRAVRAAGIDPDIPPEFFHRLGLAACTWGFSKSEVAVFAAAVAAGDQAAMAKMLWQKRRFAEVGLTELTAAVGRTLRPDGVPALGAR
jgi:hypothetical protein